MELRSDKIKSIQVQREIRLKMQDTGERFRDGQVSSLWKKKICFCRTRGISDSAHGYLAVKPMRKEKVANEHRANERSMNKKDWCRRSASWDLD